MNEAKELTLTTIRHSFYDWLKSIGVKEMEPNEKNRVEIRKFLDVYVGMKTETLRKELGLANRTNAERAAARRAKNKRKADYGNLRDLHKKEFGQVSSPNM